MQDIIPLTLFTYTSPVDIRTCCVCKKAKDASRMYQSPYHHDYKWTICLECASVGKHCPLCKKYKPFSAFARNKAATGRGATAGYCLPCSRKNRRERFKTYGQTEEAKQKVRDYHYQRNFNISESQYNEMHEAQHGLCAACGYPEMSIDGRTGQVRRLAVDHSHSTGEVRSLLCIGCNIALGHLREDPERIEALLRYAKRLQ